MSRESLAENICSAKQIQRLEEGKNEPSLYLLNCLSMKLSTNLKAVIFTQQFKYDDSIKLQLEIEKSLKTFYLDFGQEDYSMKLRNEFSIFL